MLDTTSYVYNESGQLVEIPTIDRLCLELKTKFFSQAEELDNLRIENQELKSKGWKDKEIARLLEENAKLKSDYYRGFPISYEEEVKINTWKSEHKSTAYNYTFTPTPMGIVGTIADLSGNTFEFQTI